MSEYSSTMSQEINLIQKAIVEVMREVGSIEKKSEVGANTNFAYKGVRDLDVKAKLLPLMVKNGLSVIPTAIDSELKVERWEETDYKGNPKMKSQIFLRAQCTYTLLHTSGQWIKFSGEGHGIDTGDKAAGKSTTYALKYALIYLFMIPVGHIDDADNDHSNENETPPARKGTRTPASPRPQEKSRQPKGEMKSEKWSLEVGDEKWPKVINYIVKHKAKGLPFIVGELGKFYEISKTIEKELENEIKK